MALPDHYTGKDGEIKIGGVATALVNFNIDINVGVITSGQIGQVSDLSYPGKKAVSGTITEVLITGDLMAMMMGADADITTSSTAACLAATDMSDNTRTEIVTGADTSANPTSVKVTLTSCDTSNNSAGSIVLQGTDSSGDTVTEVMSFDAITAGDANQIKYGSQIFASVDYIDVSANLRQGAGDTAWNTLKVDWVSGTKSIVLGTSEHFDIIGKVEDANGKYFQMTANNCFFTGGTFPIGDAETLVETDLPFVMRDADTDLTLVWSSA